MIHANQLGVLFSIFHDGVVDSYLVSPSRLTLVVDIQYLASLIDPAFTKFTVTLEGPEDVVFTTWPRIPSSRPQVLTNPDDIFEAELDILEASANDGQLEIVFNQGAPDIAYSGGKLRLRTSGGCVRDEAGKTYDIDEIQRIAQLYWDEWSGTTRSDKGQNKS